MGGAGAVHSPGDLVSVWTVGDGPIHDTFMQPGLRRIAPTDMLKEDNPCGT